MTSKVHLILLSWLLTQQVTGLTERSDLDMAPNAFDDQYEGCVEDMERKARQLLEEDFNMCKKFERLWKEAEVKWNETKKTMKYPKGFNDYHGTAVVAYTGHTLNNFHTAVREFKKNPSNFHYKAFHYYLTRALQLLRNQNRSCYTVYRGSKNKFHYSGEGSVRFGHFGSSSFNRRVAYVDFGGATGTLFTIKTCLGVNISGFSYKPKQMEVLIPVYEVYDSVTVEESSKWNEEITLESPKRGKSNFNCFYSSSTNKSHFSSSATLLLVVLPGLLVQLLPLVEL
ncbi:T-cell ecto-ADP-ribosyltransferase 2-like [Peromyscus leucopus]|uniref:T-cell ecto-ADP-ribosyltransferase 2-like n=1 Tax=Peromyscus leucopus TaxID=10041 RepID=UPI001884EE61|nr:T-cell ecto-ADP-ribosyltransferase 2-like [Peromyscus leucopus]XP_037052891.1 T-cell ecto-ADP-ribosyltransferase 2-like [Peromyscus leucopus]